VRLASLSASNAVQLQSSGGVSLAAHWFAANGPARASLVIACATGVPQGLYRRFALWASEQQRINVLTFDYRGTAASRPKRLRGDPSGFEHWAQDIDAALAHARALTPTLPLLFIGHSIGGLLVTQAPNAVHARRLLLVGAQTADWRDWPAWRRWPMLALWHGLMPMATLVCGHFPGRRLRLGEDLPFHVAMQWALRPWRPNWRVQLPGAPAPQDLPALHLLAASDDAFATPAAQQRVLRLLPRAQAQVHSITPQSLGLARIGHFALFRQHCAAVWPMMLHLLMAGDRPSEAAPSQRSQFS
jgi:predicted alpha/beta hydrolase